MNGKIVRIIYDGECPFCSNFVLYQHLKDSNFVIELVDARKHQVLIARLASMGMNIDDGMVVEFNNRYYHGDQAMVKISQLCVSERIFGKVINMINRNSSIAEYVYPVLRWGRNLFLRLAGIKKMVK